MFLSYLFKDISFEGLKEIQRLISMLILEELFQLTLEQNIYQQR